MEVAGPLGTPLGLAFQEMVKDRVAWHAEFQGCKELDMTEVSKLSSIVTVSIYILTSSVGGFTICYTNCDFFFFGSNFPKNAIGNLIGIALSL